MNSTQSISQRVVFIGAGNMAEALIGGLLHKGLCAAGLLCVTDVQEARRDYFQTTFSVAGMTDNPAAVTAAKVVVLAVKPQFMDDVLREIAPSVTPEKCILSLAAGVTTRKMESLLPAGARVVRVMPNTPALVGMGVAAISAGAHATEEDLALAEKLLSATGQVVRVPEKDMNAVTAVSGSGPAYVFYLIEAMESAALRLGLDPAIARRLILATVEGSARLALDTGRAPGELREQVTSKGGTTAAALDVLRAGKVDVIVEEAVCAAAARARTLSDEA